MSRARERESRGAVDVECQKNEEWQMHGMLDFVDLSYVLGEGHYMPSEKFVPRLVFMADVMVTTQHGSCT